MRVALFTPSYPGINGEGGIGTYTRALAQVLSVMGHDVLVLTGGIGRNVNDGLVSVEVIGSSYLPIVDRIVPGAGACLTARNASLRLIKEHQIDVIEFPNWEGHGLGYQISPKTPTVVRLHTSSAETQAIDGLKPTRRLRWDVKRERWSARRADALVTHSNAHREAMSAELGVSSDRIAVIPHGIDAKQGYVRQSYASATPTVVFLGRLEHRKGVIHLLKAIPGVLDEVPAARFVFIGADRAHCPGGRTHAAFAAEEFPETVQRHIEFTGPLPQADVDKRLQEATLFVAPSLYESFGLIFLEAMRWGTPVVGAAAGGIPEIITHDVDGMLAPPGDSAALGRIIVQCLQDEALRRRLGQAGQRRCREAFSAELMGQRVEQFYEQVIGQWRSRVG